MKISVIITSRDRCSDLQLTCAKLRELRPAPDEVLIFADGCRDRTTRMLRQGFPTFRLFESRHSLGSVRCRDLLLRAARGEVVLSLDDDSHPVRADFLTRLRAVAMAHPEAAVIVFPELRDDRTYSAADKAEQSPGHYVSAYANCAAAMRRRFYLRQPGFPSFFEHMYEEPDYALQCYAAGAAVWFEPTLSVRHRLSGAHRNAVRRHQQNARNELWSVWLRCPWPWLGPLSLYRIARQWLYAFSEGASWACREPEWWWEALRGWRWCRQGRRPVSWPVYRRWLRLARNPIRSVEELQRAFPLGVKTRSASNTRICL